MKRKASAIVAIVMGSESDAPTMKAAAESLEEFGIAHEMKIISAHRTPKMMVEFAVNASKRGIRVIIAGAGGAAHLPGMIASLSELPVIGVPVPIGALQGEDALLSIVQMPKGVPVATVAIGNSYNAGLLAVKILAAGDSSRAKSLRLALKNYQKKLETKVKKMSLSKV